MRRLLVLLAAVLALLAPAPAAWAQAARPPVATKHPPVRQAPARAGRVQLRVLVVHATNEHDRVDPRLGQLTRYLSHLRFSGYTLLETESLTLAVDAPQTFTIEGGRRVTVELLSRDDKRARMRVQITASKGGKLLDTTLSVNRNGTFFVAGPRYKNGVLILPLTARY